MQPLTPKNFDAAFDEAPLIWGAKAIGQRINRSPEFVRRTLAKQPNSPVRNVGGKIYAVEAELLKFFGIVPL